MMKRFLLIICLIQFSFLSAQRFYVDEDNTLSICDTDLTGGVSADSVLICQAPNEGTAIISGNCTNYTPNTDYFGYDSLCISICNSGVCIDSVVQITIRPVGEEVNFTLPEDASYLACEAILTGGSDVVFSICSPPGVAAAFVNTACLVYNLSGTNFVGNDTICLSMCVDTLCDTSSIIFSVTPIEESINVVANGPTNICYSDLMTVVYGTPNISISNPPNNGTASVNTLTNCVEYIPTPSSTGLSSTDTMSITVCNADGVCDITNVYITIPGFTVVNNSDATFLAQSLAGNGVTISNAVLNCDVSASGTFINAPNSLGINDGVILATGQAIDAEGPPANFPSTDLGGAGDPDLNVILTSLGETYTTNDACILEFDIEVLGDSLTFNYAMGSEEYPEAVTNADNYVCGTVNDVFGFFISGINPLGGNYTSQNIAYIPGTTTPVSINTVNNGVSSGGGASTCILTNNAYYNGAINLIAYDGITSSLQAVAYTVPCETYHFKLAVADGGDNVWDSGVFLEAGSFQSIPVSVASQTNLGTNYVNAVEGCVEGEFIFELDNPLSYDYVLHFGIGGSAVNGVDYVNIPDSIIIPSGDTTYTLNITTIPDGLVEGTEEVKLYLINGCSSEPYDSASIDLIDAIPFNISTTNSLVCPGDSASLNAEIPGASGSSATYAWTQNGTVLDTAIGNTFATPITSTWYYVDYTLGNCTLSDSIFIEVSTFSVDIDSSSISCPGSNDGTLWLTPYNAIGNVSYSWLPVVSTDSLVTNLGPDTFYYVVSDQSNLHCGTLSDTVILSEPAGLSFDVDTTNISCFNANDGTITLSNLQTNSIYEIAIFYESSLLYPLQNYTSDNTGQILFDNLAAGSYDSIYVNFPTSGCSNYFSVALEQPDSLSVQILLSDSISCFGGQADSLYTQTIGGLIPYEYTWNTGDTLSSLLNINSGTYWVQVSDSNNCLAHDTIIVSQTDSIYFSLDADSASCNGSNDGLAYVDSLTGGYPPFSFNWSSNAANQTTDTAFNLNAGTYILSLSDANNCTFTDSITVYEPLAISLASSQTDVSCYGDTTGVIDVTVTNGFSPLSYNWTGPNSFSSSAEDINNLEAGNYTLILTDNQNCTDTLEVSINEPDSLSLVVSTTNISCKDANDGTATVNVSGGIAPYSYNWNGGSNPTSSSVSNLSPAIYQVVVSDANGCIDSASTNLLSEPDSLLMSVDAVTNVQCNGGSDGGILLTTTGGTPTYSYLWTNSSNTNEDLSNVSAGNYAVTVTDQNNCSYTLDTTITEPSAIAITLSKVDVDCYDALTGSIDATVSGGVVATNYTYSWASSNGFTASTEDISNIGAGTYTLTVTDDNNCTHSESINITQPTTVVIEVDEQAVSCFGGNDGALTASVSSGGTVPFTYQWDVAASSQNTATAINLSEGIYVVEVTDANACTYTDSAYVSQPSAPLSLTIDSTDISCANYNDGSASVNATGGTPGYTYNWSVSTGIDDNMVDNLPPGNVNVTVTDANGCSETISTFINEPTPLSVIAFPDSVNCWGDNTGSILLEASGGTGVGYLYSINNGNDFQNDSVFNNLNAGIYNEIVILDLGATTECISQAVQTIVHESNYFEFQVLPKDTTLQLLEDVELELNVSNPYSIDDIQAVSWTPTAGLSCDDCLNPTVLSYENYTEYNVIVHYEGQDDEWCTQSSSTIVRVENNLNLYIPNAFTPSDFDNVNNTFKVYGEGIEVIEMQIFNRWGELIFNSTNQATGWDGKYKGELQNPGVYTYFVTVKYLDDKELTKKGSVTLIR